MLGRADLEVTGCVKRRIPIVEEQRTDSNTGKCACPTMVKLRVTKFQSLLSFNLP